MQSYQEAKPDNERPRLTYAASLTLSGLTLPPGRRLDLDHGLVTQNAAASPWESPDELSPNVHPSEQTKIPFRKIARWLLILEFEAEAPLQLSHVMEYAEKAVLPLRLGTPSLILLDCLKVVPKRTIEELAEAGSDQPAPEPYGTNFRVELSDEQCEYLENALPWLTYNPRYDLPLMHYSSATTNFSPSEAGLKYLLAFETLFDPNGESRGQSARVASRASAFAARSIRARRGMRDLIETAYKHRKSLRHGETREEKLQAAHTWFKEHIGELRIIAAWAIQRILLLSALSLDFDVSSWVTSIEHGDKSVLQKVMGVPTFWASTGRPIMHLDPRQGYLLGNGTVEFIRYP